MYKFLRQRAETPELMDDLTMGGAELQEALRHLRRINRLFAAARPTFYGVRQLWLAAGQPKQLSILDVGCGSGDVNRLILKWAKRHNIDIQITLTDITEEACTEARRLFEHDQRVSVMKQDLFQLSPDMADIVTATQVVHHFSSQQLSTIVSHLLSASRIGVVINDIHRHWLSWTAVWAVSRLISRNRYIRHDAALSVAKGFCAEDWSVLMRELIDAGAVCPQDAYVQWLPLFRYIFTVRKTDGGEASDV